MWNSPCRLDWTKFKQSKNKKTAKIKKNKKTKNKKTKSKKIGNHEFPQHLSCASGDKIYKQVDITF
jgi:hypothetical protein